MTISALGGLASRRTADARKVAVQRLEAMRKAALVIGQAETHAECKIPLDVSLVKRVNLLMKRSVNGDIQKSDYLTTLEISEKAAAARDEILRAANQALKAELEAREKAKHEEAKGAGRPQPPDRPALGLVFGLGFGLTVVSIILSCCMGLTSVANLTEAEKNSAATVAKLETEYQAAQQKEKTLEAWSPPSENARWTREYELRKSSDAAAKLQNDLQKAKEKNKADQAALARSKAEGGKSTLFTLLSSALGVGWLGVIIVPGIIYGIWGLRCNATKVDAQRFDARLQESLARLEAQQQKVEDALDLLAGLGPVRAAPTPSPMPYRKPENDDDDFEAEIEDDDDERWERR